MRWVKVNWFNASHGSKEIIGTGGKRYTYFNVNRRKFRAISLEELLGCNFLCLNSLRKAPISARITSLMNFNARLSSDTIEVEPGSTTSVEVSIDFSGTEAEQFEVVVEGLDGEWYAIPVPSLFINPSEAAEAKIFFKPPRSPESLTGTYPFSIKVRSLVSGEFRQLPANIIIQPFYGLTSDIDPRRGSVSALRPHDYFVLMLVNFGNVAQTVQLMGMDNDDELQFDFEEEQVQLAPGQQKDINITIRSKTRKLFAAAKLHQVSIQARNTEIQSISTTAQATVSQHPLLTATTLGIMTLLAVIAGFWIALIPKEPTVTFDVEPKNAKVGQEVTLNWSSTNASGVKITLDGNAIYPELEPRGQRKYKLLEEGDNVFEAIAYTQTRKTEPKTQVVQAEEVPEPKILDLKVNKSRINQGESFILSYKFSPDVTKAVLGPDDKELNLSLNEVAITPNTPGDLQYVVIASNDGGKKVKRSVKIRVRQVSRANIVSFTVQPDHLAAPGAVAISWEVTGASSVTLTSPDGTNVVEPKDNRSVQVTKSCTLVLTVTDPFQMVTRQTIKVKVDEPPPVTPTDTTGTDGITPVPQGKAPEPTPPASNGGNR